MRELLSYRWARESLRVAGGFACGSAFLIAGSGTALEFLFAISAAIFLGWTPTVCVIGQLRKGRFSVDSLMLIAAGGAMLLGNVWEGILLLFLFSLSHALESYAAWKTAQSLKLTREKFPEKTMRRNNSGQPGGASWEEIGVGEVRVGDELLLRSGEIVPVDGTVSEGESSIDESSLTGEALPVPKKTGDLVKSGTLNLTGQLTLRALTTAEESTAQKILELVKAAKEEHSREQTFSDVIGQRYTWAVLIISILAAIVWCIRGVPLRETIYSTLALLVVASPCALVISIPAAVLAAIARGASAGVIFRGGKALDGLGRVSQICFDKTGTLTTGELHIIGAHLLDGAPVELTDEILSTLVSLERASTHPIARAFVRTAEERNLAPVEASQIHVHPGLGIEGTVNGRSCRIGSRKFFQLPLNTPSSSGSRPETLEVIAQMDDQILVLELSDTIRPETVQVIENIRDLGCKNIILSGDRLSNVEIVAKQAKVEEYYADLSPEEKLTKLRELRKTYGPVAMVGEGLNDAPSLTGADVAVVMGGRGSGTALREGGVILMNDALGQLPYALRLSRVARRVILQNLVIAIGVAVCLIAIALFRDLKLSLGVLGHEGSTVIVVLNSLRLLRFGGGGLRGS